MCILIGDSGSTKTDWAYLIDNEVQLFTTQGLNPNHLTDAEIKHILSIELGSFVDIQTVEKIIFYGAGLGNQGAKDFLYSVFKQVFNKGQQIRLAHDVLGAAHALYEDNEKGIVCILGTGSIAGYFDGRDIVKTTGGLGYLLGDEGSGTYLGKLLIKEYAQQKLPKHLENALWEHIQIKNTEILHFLYKQTRPNQFLAQLTHFIWKFRKENAIQSIIHTAFEHFFEYTLEYLFSLYPEKSIRCIGSVGYLFQDELKQVMTKHHIDIEKVIQKPIQGLAEKYKNKDIAK